MLWRTQTVEFVKLGTVFTEFTYDYNRRIKYWGLAHEQQQIYR